MKKQILEALKTRFDGVSEKILDRIAEKLAKTITTEDAITTSVEGVTFQQVLDSYGDSRATEAQQTAIRNYEAKHNLKDGKAIMGGEPNEPKKQPTQNPNDTPDWAKALVESNKALTARLTKLEMERVTNSRKKQLSAIVEKLPQSLRKAYERTPIDALSDEEFSALLSEVDSETKVIDDELQAKGAVFGRPSSTSVKGKNAKEASDAETNALMSKLNV